MRILIGLLVACLALQAPPAAAVMVECASLEFVVSRSNTVYIVEVTEEEPRLQAENDWVSATARVDTMLAGYWNRSVQFSYFAPSTASLTGQFFLYCEGRGGKAIYNLSHPDQYGSHAALTQDFDVLVDSLQIVPLVVRTLTHRDRQAGWRRVDLPGGTPAYQSQWAGSSVSMLIVNDPDFEHRLIESALSSSVWQRARAAVVLRYIPGKASRRVLADLFNDTEVAVVRGSSGRELALRPVRTLACMALGRMKEVPPEEACWDVLLDPGVDLIDYTYKRSRPISDQLLKTR